MRSSTDGSVDLQNLSVSPDVERRSRCKSRRAEHAVRARGVFRRIAQDRKVELERRRELRVLLDAVGARRKIRDVERPQRIAARPERLAFRRSAACESLRKPCHDDGPDASKLAETVCTAVGRRELEVGCGVAGRQFRFASKQRQVVSRFHAILGMRFKLEWLLHCTFFFVDARFSNSADLG